LLAQTRPPDEILVVDNASTDNTGAVASAIPGVHVIDEPRKGLVIAREAARRAATSDVLAYVDADCRVAAVARTRRATVQRARRARGRLRGLRAQGSRLKRA